MSYKNWRNITIENEIKEYVIEICNNLLERLNCPEKIIEENGISLGSGSSGIIILLNEINKVLNIDTRELIHQYICYSEKYIYQNLGVFSLYEGITGFNYAVSIINNNTGDYANLLLELDKLFIKGVNLFLDSINNFSNIIKNDYEFDVINGMAGIGRYVLSRKNNNSEMRDLCYRIAEYLVKLTEDLVIDNKKIKGWGVYEKILDKKNNFIYTNNIEYNLGLAHGVPGVLATLSLFYTNGINVENQLISINEITNWLISTENKLEDNLWPYSIRLDDEYNKDYKRIAWCYGNPSISVSLFLASKAVNNDNLLLKSREIFNNMFRYKYDFWSITSPMLCHGFGGILTIMLRISESKILKEKYESLFKIIISNVNYSKDFCFNNNDIINNYDLPGFIMGSSGIVLSLLNLISISEPDWDQLLLLS